MFTTRGPGPMARPRGAVTGAGDLVLGVVSPGLPDTADRRRSRFDSLRRKAEARNVATQQDLIEVRDSLRADVAQLRMEAKLELALKTSQMQTVVEELRDQVQRELSQATAERERSSIENQAYIEGSIARIQQELRVTAATLQGRLSENLGAMEISLQASRILEVAREQALERRCWELSAESTARVEVRWVAQKVLLEQESAALTEHIDSLRKDFGLKVNSIQSLADAGFEKLATLLAETQLTFGAKTQRLDEELRGRVTLLEGLFQDYRGKGEEQMATTREMTQQNISDIRTETHTRLAWLDEQSQHLRTLVATVENIPTRRVDWQVPDAVARLPELLQGHSLRSPIFEAAGAHGLQLQLSLSAGVPAGTPGGAADAIGAGAQRTSGEPAQAVRSCDLSFWGQKGLYIVVRLYCGSAAVQLEHTFDGQSPCVARGLCFFHEQISAKDGSIHLGMEVLEAVTEVAQYRGSSTSAGAFGGSGGGDGVSAAAEDKPGAIVTYRYLNHRILDMVQHQVERMRSRLVRRVEWRIEQAASLRRLFPEGECLCSMPFEAAGVEGLQMVFYPSGYDGVREGYCSYFLHVPAGASLRCWLSIGKNRREGRLAFERPGFHGRTNFCRYEFAADPAEDVVVLVLEIDEAQQTVTETFSQNAPCLTARSLRAASPAALPGVPGAAAAAAGAAAATPVATSSGGGGGAAAVGLAPECGSPLPQERVDSSVSFRRNPGKSALEDVKQLPSIWTSKPQANLAEALHGFHSFNDLKMRKPQSSRRTPSSLSCRGETQTPNGGAATPVQPAQRYLMYA